MDVAKEETMGIAISATGRDLDAEVDPRFGRCPYFIIVDTDTMEFEAVENVHAGGSGGVGIAAAQMIIDKGVEAVLTGDMGPNASRVFSSAGIPVTTGVSGTVREAAEAFTRDGTGASAGTAATGTATPGVTKPGLGLRQRATRGLGTGGGRGGGRGKGLGPGMAWRHGGGPGGGRGGRGGGRGAGRGTGRGLGRRQ